ncbi:MAG: hypothetical protein L6E13_09620 [Firmicutes bacterium]|nr:hypothetical protein [Bacillota bacterium]
MSRVSPVTAVQNLWGRARAAGRVVLRSLPLLWEASPAYTAAVAISILLQGLLPTVAVWLSQPLVDAALALGGATEARWERVLPLATLWLGALLASHLIAPVASAAQGLLTDRLTAHVNLKLMKKAGSLPDLQYFE